MGDAQAIAAVALEISIGKTLDYSIPAELIESAQPGAFVKVPVRGRAHRGVIVSLKEKPEIAKVMPIESVVSQTLLPLSLLDLARWMSRYYATPIGQVLKILVPPGVRDPVAPKEQSVVRRGKTRTELRAAYRELAESQPAQAKVLEVLLPLKGDILLSQLLEQAQVSRSPVETLAKKGLLLIERLKVDRSPLIDEEYFRTPPKQLNPEQSHAYEKIVAALGSYQTFLLHGVTGSGKTEVYLQAISQTLEQGKGVIFLVPEIALTSQTIERLRSRFEGNIAVLHHRLSQGERFDEWQRIRFGKAQIVIGARSAIFSPVPSLGLIIVDEEHDSAYKQSEEMPCYHARDLAVVRARQEGAVAVLGTATPSLESYRNALEGKYTLLPLTTRPDDGKLPQVQMIDMRPEFEKARGFTPFSSALIDALKLRFERGEQAILFLNRRGYHTSYLCTHCSHVFTCPHCDLPLTFHLGENILACHLCDHRESPKTACPKCHHKEMLKYRGMGTESVERSLRAVLPDIRTLRIDGDTTRHKGSHERLLRSFRTGKSDVLIGTQMIAKGLHFPSVTLVAILNCDGALQIPDFRSSERTFQLITQVAGRAGRGDLAGEVLLQTQMPDNETLRLAAAQDYQGFYTLESALRETFEFPPSTRLIKCLFSGENEQETYQWACRYRAALLPGLPESVAVHPVLPAGYPKINDRYRFHMLIRGPSLINLPWPSLALPRAVRVLIDVDPLSTFF